MKLNAQLSIALALVAALALSQLNARREAEERLTALQSQLAGILDQVDASSAARLDDERELAALRQELTARNSELAALNNELRRTQEQVDPDLALMERTLRQRVERELRAEQLDNSTASLVRQLSALDPVEMGEVMLIQGQYGGFLQSLNVSDARMDEIVGALQDLIAEQNQARMQAMRQLTQDGADPRAMRSQMMAVMDPATQRESLSYTLTDAELAAYDAWQQTRADSFTAFAGGVSIAGDSGQAMRAINLDSVSGNGAAVFIGTEETTTADGTVIKQLIVDPARDFIPDDNSPNR